MPGPIGSALLGAVPEIIGGLFGAGGSAMTNRANAREAQKNRDWQERMSSTAAQRARADMEAAGLNPGLAYGYQAGTGGGGQATMQDPIAAGIANARSIREHRAAVEKVKADTAKVDAETALLNTERSIRETTVNDEPTWRDEKIAERRDRMAGFEHNRAMRPLTQQDQQLKNRLQSLGVPEREARALITTDVSSFYKGITRDVPETAAAWDQAFQAWVRATGNRSRLNRQQFRQLITGQRSLTRKP